MEASLKHLLTMVSGFGSPKMEEVGLIAFVLLLAVSLLTSFLVSSLYVTFYESRATGSQIHRAFPLLGLSVTAIFICIQFSLPLSLGLLGALSIVRFRTPIKEPEEVGFIMLVIATSIACATFNLAFLSLLLSFAILGLLIQKYGPRVFAEKLSDGMILITLPEPEYQKHSDAIFEILKKFLKKGQLESLSKNGDQSIVSYSFSRLNQDSLSQLQTALESFKSQLNFNLYFNRKPMF